MPQLDKDKANEGRKEAGIHESYNMTFDGIRMLQIWNPFLQTGPQNPDLTMQLELFQQERLHPVPIKDQKSAGLIMLGAGSWFALDHYQGEALERFQRAMNNVTDIIHHQDFPFFGTPERHMDPFDGVGAEVFIAPVAPPLYNELPEDRKSPKGIQPGEVEAIDDYLASIEDNRRLSLLWSFLALTRGNPEALVDRKITGFHVIDTVAEIKANILLNLRCNAKLDRLQGHTGDRTCCTDYNSMSLIQRGLITIALIYILGCIVCEALDLWLGRPSRMPLLNMEAGMFVTALLCCYYADRSQIFAKGSKQLIYNEFSIFSALAAFIGLVSIRKSQQSSKSQPSMPQESQPFLSRDQTDEWKGWMQALILIYHWCGASKSLEIYIIIRLLVAAYLFQTGYGHTLYFLAKKDFSFKRVVTTMLRLNLLSCALPYIMGTNYMLYYFAPLVSFWFIVVYTTMAVGSKHNYSLRILLWKIVISCILISTILLLTPLPRWTFTILRTIFRIDWDLREWEFRMCLDGFIVYIGMLVAIIYHLANQYNPTLIDRSAVAILGLVGLPVYWYICVTTFKSKQSYNQWHPYISFMPILAFIALRNMAGPVRSYYSKTFAWLGRCSLETFTLQFHLFLAADTKGVLLLDLFRGGDGTLLHDRWRDLVFTLPVFLWLSWRVAGATGYIVKLFTDTGTGGGNADDAEKDIGAEPLMTASRFSRYTSLAQTVHIVRGITSLLADLRFRMTALLAFVWLLNLVSRLLNYKSTLLKASSNSVVV